MLIISWENIKMYQNCDVQISKLPYQYYDKGHLYCAKSTHYHIN